MIHVIGRLEQIGCIGSMSDVRGELIVEVPVKLESKTIESCKIGAFSYIQPGGEIGNAHIGRFCSIAANVVIGPGSHPVDFLSSHPFVLDPGDAVCRFTSIFPSYRDWLGSKASRDVIPHLVSIGNDVWIGLSAIVMKGVHIGDGAIVAAGAVVTRDVAPYSIVAGVPARHVRYRFDEGIIERLLKVRWWDYDLRPLTARIDYADVPSALDMIECAIKHSVIERLQPSLFYIADGVIYPIRGEA